ncbi:MAG: repressor LexA [Clostridia bacterium]|nr:repressor LexA [Clostridia bacterium]
MKSISEERLAAVKDFITGYFDRRGRSPSLTEIAAGTGIAQTSVYRCLHALADRGDLVFDGGRRNLLPAGCGETVRVPVLGRIVCGIPAYAEENIEEYVRLPVAVFGRGEYFLLRAYGDSMVGAGICDGDLVVVSRQNFASPGDVVVALAGDETTLKRYYPEPEKKRVRLHPENPSMEDILLPSCEIQGVAVKVIKDI